VSRRKLGDSAQLFDGALARFRSWRDAVRHKLSESCNIFWSRCVRATVHYAASKSPADEFCRISQLVADLGFWWGLKNLQKTFRRNGILLASILNDGAADRLFLSIEIEHKQYMECLALMDAVFGRHLYNFLQGHLGKSVKEIGDLDFSQTLYYRIIENGARAGAVFQNSGF
jgi:hypothetical protein